MSLITIEDQSPIMRRAKIRATVAVVLLLVAAGSLLMLNEQAPSTSQIKTAAAPAKAAVAKTLPQQTSASSPPQAQPSPTPNEIDAKPPVAPPDPVYTSFTAPATPAAEPVAASAPPVPMTTNTPPVPAPQAVAESKSAQAQPVSAPQQEVTQAQTASVAKPAPPKPERAAAKIEVSPTGSHILQVGVFADMNNARKQQAKLTTSGIPAHTSTRLKIGPLSNMAEIDTAREKVRASGINVTLADDIVSGAKGASLSAGQYADMDQARRLQASLNELGLPANTETRLLVGPFTNKAKADAARNKIKKLNISVVLMPHH